MHAPRQDASPSQMTRSKQKGMDKRLEDHLDGKRFTGLTDTDDDVIDTSSLKRQR